jgi:hypothetical protein
VLRARLALTSNIAMRVLLSRVAPWTLVAAFAGVLIYVAVECRILELRIAFALDQVAVFEDCARRARQLPVDKKGPLIDYIRNYYPSGTKQVAGGDLDQIVERARRMAIDEVSK